MSVRSTLTALRDRRRIICLALSLILLSHSSTQAEDGTIQTSSPSGQIYQLTVKAKKYIEADQLDSALIAAYQADSLAKSCADCGDTTLAAVYNNLAYCHFRNESPETGLAYLDSALAQINDSEHGHDSLVADIYGNYGRIYDQLSRYTEAIESYEKALEIQQAALGPDHVEVGTICNNLAIVKTYTGQYDEAEQLYIRTLKIWRNALGEDHPDVGLCLFNLGYLYDDLGRYEDAEKCYYQSLVIREKSLGPEHSSIGFIYANIAALQSTAGKSDSAIASLTRAREIIGKSLGERSIYYASVLSSIGGLIINTRGDYAEGEALYKEALSICNETLGPEHAFAASMYTRLASLNSIFGKLELGLEYSKKAAAITARVYGDKSINYAYEVARLADAYAALIGYLDISPAMVDSLYNVYQDIIDECGSSNIEVYCLSTKILGGALYNAGLIDKSMSTLKHYLSISDQQSENIGVYGELALVALMTGQHDEAAEYARTAERALADDKHLPMDRLAYHHSVLAEFYLFDGDPNNAMKHMLLSRGYENRFLKIASSNASQATKIALLNQGICTSLLPTKLHENYTPEMLALAFEIETTHKSYVIDAISHEHEIMQCSNDPSLQMMCSRYSYISSRAANLVRAGMMDDEQNVDAEMITGLLRERDSLESVISSLCDDHTPLSSASTVTAKAIAGCLGPGEILIEYIRFLKTDSIIPENILRRDNKINYGAFILGHDGRIDFYDLGPAKTIDSLVVASRDYIANTGTKALTALGKTIEQQLSDINRALYHKLLSPFAARLDNIDHLIIAPERNICLIPFGILPVDNDRYLIEQHRISYISSGADLLHRRNTSPDREGPFVVLADPDFDCDLRATDSFKAAQPFPEPADSLDVEDSFRSGDCSLTGFDRLPYTAEETRSIEKLVHEYSSRQLLVFTGDKAREIALTSLKPAPTALHIATHGFTCASEQTDFQSKYVSPLFQSGLVLAGANNKPAPRLSRMPDSYEDGVLTAYEVSSLNLIGTDLVVLSACESGVGEYISGMGVMGLHSSFRQAGARTVIMSLWKVPDEMSARTMQGFYRRWLGGESKIDALRETSLELLENARAQYGNGHPIHWAGFILSGKSE